MTGCAGSTGAPGESFEAEEADLLQPLPDDPFESVEYKQLKVGRNYHVTSNYQHYSVQYQLAGKILSVRITARTVTVFDGQVKVCEHARKTGRRGQYSTELAHAPEHHQQVQGLWSREWFVAGARAFGPATVQVISQILDGSKIEAQAYLTCRNILSELGKKKALLEEACQELVNVNGYPTYTSIKRVMATLAHGKEQSAVVAPAPQNVKDLEVVQDLPGVSCEVPSTIKGSVVAMLSSEDHQKIKELRLTVFAEKFFALVQDEANYKLLPEDVFMAAVEHSLDTRRSNRIDRLIKQARFPLPKASIAELHYGPGRKIDEARMKRYATHQWRYDPTNLLIIAPSGGGKTYVACAIGIAACHSEHSVFYTRMDVLARKLLIARENGRDHEALLEKLREADLLIDDDFLTVGLDQNIASDVYGVLADREHRLPTVIVSQTDPSYWVQVLPDRVAGDSIVNRLANNTHWLLLGDADMRQLKHEKARESADFWE